MSISIATSVTTTMVMKNAGVKMNVIDCTLVQTDCSVKSCQNMVQLPVCAACAVICMCHMKWASPSTAALGCIEACTGIAIARQARARKNGSLSFIENSSGLFRRNAYNLVYMTKRTDFSSYLLSLTVRFFLTKY